MLLKQGRPLFHSRPHYVTRSFILWLWKKLSFGIYDPIKYEQARTLYVCSCLIGFFQSILQQILIPSFWKVLEVGLKVFRICT